MLIEGPLPIPCFPLKNVEYEKTVASKANQIFRVKKFVKFFWASRNPFNITTTTTWVSELVLHPTSDYSYIRRHWLAISFSSRSERPFESIWCHFSRLMDDSLWMSGEWCCQQTGSNQSGSLWMKESMKRSLLYLLPHNFHPLKGGNRYGCHPTKLSRNRGF